MKLESWKFEQTQPASIWQVDNIPDNAQHAVIKFIETTTGQILQPEYQVRAPYGIELSFGINEYAGLAIGEYYTEDIEINGNGGTINVVINQNNPTPRV